MKTSLIISVIAVLGVTSAWFVRPEEAATAAPSLDRKTLPIRTDVLKPITSIQRERQYSGTVVAARRTRLAFERSARLIEVLVDEGDVVSEGQILARIDQRQLQTQLTAVQAELAQQQAVLAELDAGPRQETIAAMRAESEAWAADVELRLATLNRIDGLYKRSATSAQSVDEARLNWKSGSARRDAVMKQLEELQAGTREEKLAAQKAVVAGLEARLASLQIDVDDSELKAPFAGTIVRRNADDGDMLSPQQAVFELLETGHLEARIGIPSALVSELSREDYYILKAGSVEVTGKVRSVLAQVEQSTRTQIVVIDIDEANTADLADGQLIRMGFDVPIEVEGFEIPLTALASGSRGLWSVYVVEPAVDLDSHQTIAARSVEVLHTNGSSVVVRGAVYEGENLVVEGVHRVVPGQLVTDDSSSVAAGRKAILVGD